MSKSDPQIMVFLKITHDVLVNFSSLADILIESKKKYGVTWNDMKAINFSDPEFLQELPSDLSSQKIHTLWLTMAELQKMQKDFPNIMTLNESELSSFKSKLESVTKKLNEIVGSG